jgi:hypothetical protein
MKPGHMLFLASYIIIIRTTMMKTSADAVLQLSIQLIGHHSIYTRSVVAHKSFNRLLDQVRMTGTTGKLFVRFAKTQRRRIVGRFVFFATARGLLRTAQDFAPRCVNPFTSLLTVSSSPTKYCIP